MLILIGASASGKTEIAKRLIRNHGFKKTVTYTTRPPRHGEIDGVDYHFLRTETFIIKEKTGFFLETSQYNGYHYGTAFQDAAFDKVLIVDVNGANAIYEALPDDVLIFFINTPAEVRKERMLKRGDRPEDIEKRLAIDDKYFLTERIDHIDHIILNDRCDINEVTQVVYEKYKSTMHV